MLKKIITGIIIIAVLIIFVPKPEFKSVDRYNKEQKNLTEEYIEASIVPEYSQKESNAENVQSSIKTTAKPNIVKTKNNKKKSKIKKEEATGDKKNKKTNIKEPIEKKADANTDIVKTEIKEKTEKKETKKKKRTDTKDKPKTDTKTNVKIEVNKDITKSDIEIKEEANNSDISIEEDEKKENDIIQNENQDEADSEYITCNVTIDCISVLDNIDMLDTSVKKYIPSDGIMLQQSTIKLEKNCSAYDALIKACKLNSIQYDAEYSKVYSSSYVKGIGYLYEKMAGDMSGWLYLVNGKSVNIGASGYIVNEGDTITWTYTCSGRSGS